MLDMDISFRSMCNFLVGGRRDAGVPVATDGMPGDPRVLGAALEKRRLERMLRDEGFSRSRAVQLAGERFRRPKA